jgi:hypothetical protein
VAERPRAISSVFRGRPDAVNNKRKAMPVKNDNNNGVDDDDVAIADDGPQKILLSFQTPTMSFDDKDHHMPGGVYNDSKASKNPPSPDILQSGSAQIRTVDTIFEVSALSVYVSMSFSLFFVLVCMYVR